MDDNSPILDITDIRSFEKFFKEHYKAFCMFANKFVQNIEVAEDIVSNTFLKYWENKEDINFTSSIKNYFLTTIKNNSFNYLQHQKIKQKYEHFISLETNNFVSSDFLEEFELEEKILKAIGNLTKQQKIIFEMRNFEKLKHKEIAEKLNLSVKTVENHFAKAIQVLKEQLKDYLILIIFYFFIGNFLF